MQGSNQIACLILPKPETRIAGRQIGFQLDTERLIRAHIPARPCQPHFGQRHQQPPIADVMTGGQQLLLIQGQHQFPDPPFGGEIDEGRRPSLLPLNSHQILTTPQPALAAAAAQLYQA